MRTRSVNRVYGAVLGACLSLLAVTPLLAEEPLPWQQNGDSGAAPYGSGDTRYPQEGSAREPAPAEYGYGQQPAPRQSEYGYEQPRPAEHGYERPAPQRGEGAYAAGNGDESDGAYRPQGSPEPRDRRFTDPGEPVNDGGPGYGEPYTPPAGADERNGEPAEQQGGTFDQNEILAAGHGLFGAVSQSLAGAVEYAFKSQGRPNGYILGEDAGGAFILGLRYGEGTLYTKDAGDHKVFWQGPSLGYDAGAEGSKTMVLVYNLRDPSEIYNRFGGVQGSAYLVGGISVQFQKYGDVTLGIIRSGVGLRLGANVGYLKYTRSPTWNPL